MPTIVTFVQRTNVGAVSAACESLAPLLHTVEDVANGCKSWSHLGSSEDGGRCSYTPPGEGDELCTAGLQLARPDANSHTWIVLGGGGLIYFKSM